MHTFQFTQPKRAATLIEGKKEGGDWFQFTQPKRAATVVAVTSTIARQVSIHAAQAGCDKALSCGGDGLLLFQFTQPKRAATVVVIPIFGELGVSIHAAQAGCDTER